jgi:hypothetical protein
MLSFSWLAWVVFGVYTATFGVMLGSFAPSPFAVGKWIFTVQKPVLSD